jgi:hypothetical protein
MWVDMRGERSFNTPYQAARAGRRMEDREFLAASHRYRIVTGWASVHAADQRIKEQIISGGCRAFPGIADPPLHSGELDPPRAREERLARPGRRW